MPLSLHDETDKIFSEEGDKAAALARLFARAPQNVCGMTATIAAWPQDRESKEALTAPTYQHIAVGSAVADKSQYQDITPDTAFAIGSVTKMFTAATMLRLIELRPDAFPESVNTRLSAFAPALKAKYPDSDFIRDIESQDHYADMTMRDLLQHTHGIGNFSEACCVEAFDSVHKDRVWLPSETLTKKNIEKTDRDKFGQFKYSNAGYALAALVIETVAGKPYREVVQKLVIKPLGLRNTYTGDQIRDKQHDPGVDIAHGRDVDINGNIIAGPTFNAFHGSGDMYSTPADLAIFTRAFLTQNPTHSLFQSDVTRKVMMSNRKPIGGDYSSGLGFFVNTKTGLLSHDGDVISFLSRAIYDPAKDCAYAISHMKQMLKIDLHLELGKLIKAKLQEDTTFDKLAMNAQHNATLGVLEDMCMQRPLSEIARGLHQDVDGNMPVERFIQEAIEKAKESKLAASETPPQQQPSQPSDLARMPPQDQREVKDIQDKAATVAQHAKSSTTPESKDKTKLSHVEKMLESKDNKQKGSV